MPDDDHEISPRDHGEEIALFRFGVIGALTRRTLERGGATPRFARVVGAVQSPAAPHATAHPGVGGEVVVEAKQGIVDALGRSAIGGTVVPSFRLPGLSGGDPLGSC